MTERILTYRPGTWLAIVGLNATVLLPNSEKARVGALWERIDAGAEFDGVLDALVAGGLSSLPGFVLFGDGAEPGSTRVVVRGEAEVNFESDDEIVTVTSNSTEMWRERTVAADQFEIALPGEEADGPELAVLGGLVRVSRLATSTPTSSPSFASIDDSAQLAPVLHLAVPPAAAETGAPLVLPPVPPISVADLPPVPTSVEDDLEPQVEAELEAELEAEPEVEPTPEVEPELDDAELPTDRFEALEAEAVEAHVGEAVPAPVAAPEHDLDEDEDDLPTDIFPAYTDAVPAEVADYDEGPTDVIDEPGEVDLDDLTEDIAPEDVDPDAETGDLEGGAIPAAPIVPPAPVIPPAPVAAPAVAVPPAPAEPAAPPVAAEPVRPQAPRLSFSHGAEVEVAGLVVVGRNPDPRRFADTEQPHLVVVPSPHSEISSTHVEIRPGAGQHAGQAVVTDLGSTNGTLVVQPGAKPEEISPGVPVALRSGALIDLGDGMTIRVR